MRKEVRDELCAALRSGEYTQCFGRIGSSDCRCTLGVLQDIAERDGIVPVQERHYSPSVDVIEWSGLTNKEYRELIYMNDIERLSFAEIAEKLEALNVN